MSWALYETVLFNNKLILKLMPNLLKRMLIFAFQTNTVTSAVYCLKFIAGN